VASPQTGIFALGASSHAWLELDVAAGVDPAAAVGLVASLREPRTTIGGVNVVTGFRPELWASLVRGGAPPELTGFNQPVLVDGRTALPATQHDLVL
jgi:porphyrinogen peroxidase